MKNCDSKPEYWVLALSGGKDSTALGLEWLKRHQQDPVTYHLHEVIYCDTGMEFPSMVEHISRLEQIFTGAGIKFTRVKGKQTFEFLMFDYQPKRRNPALKDKSGWSWPGPRTRWCTKELKTKVINKYLDTLRSRYSMVRLVGLAADEQARLNRKHNQNPEYRHPLVFRLTEPVNLCLNFGNGLKMPDAQSTHKNSDFTIEEYESEIKIVKENRK